MYAFVEDPEITSSTSQYTQRQPEIDWLDWHSRPSARLVVPHGRPEARLNAYEHDQLSSGWREAQVASLIGDVFAELFDTDAPDYPEIIAMAEAWQQNMMDAWSRDPSLAHQTACELLQGVLNAARAGQQGQPTWWSPKRRGLNVEAHPTPTPDHVELGTWFEACATNGERWRVRKLGDRVLAETLHRSFNRSIELTKEQARKSFRIIGYFQPAA